MNEPLASEVKRTVLVVDGDPAFGHSIAAEFAAHACTVESVGTAEEAVARVAAAPPDLVLLDPYLPNGAALTLIRRWKVERPTLVILLVSGNASLAVVVDALREGARDFFIKPVRARELLDELEERPTAEAGRRSPLLAANHQLCSASLKADGVDRFFAITPGLLSIAGFDGYFKMLNPAWEKMLGYTVDELCAKPYLDLIHPDDRVKATDEALEVRAGRSVFRFKDRYRCKDGTYRWLEWMAMPSPTHRLIYAAARDVTKNVRMEQGLRESNERLKIDNDALAQVGQFKDEVTAMIVHDLKSPLSVIVANYDYILEGFEGSADCLEALHDSRDAGRRMLRLLANLVDVARLEGGTLELRPSRVDLAQLLLPAVDQRRVLARSRKIALVFAPQELMVTIDADLVTRTIENILDNALRHAPSEGRIEISLGQSGPDAEIRIGNSGNAIPVGVREAVFEKSCQATSEFGRMNLGLGLYFCRLAIEALGGKIWIEETAELPALFVIRVPLLAMTNARAVPGSGQDHVVSR